MKSKYIVIILFFMTIYLNILVLSSQETVATSEKSEFEIEPAREGSLGYGEYFTLYKEDIDEDYKIKWEFSGSNTAVGITVFAVTEEEFDDFETYKSVEGYSLSDGDYYEDDGSFTPTSHDDWYIVFFNNDGDLQSTYLTYDAEFEYTGIDEDIPPYILYLPFIIIVIMIIVGVIIIIVLVKAITKKSSKRPPSYIPTTMQPPQAYHPAPVYQTGPMQTTQNLPQSQGMPSFCPRCGVKLTGNAKFCINCGSKVD